MISPRPPHTRAGSSGRFARAAGPQYKGSRGDHPPWRVQGGALPKMKRKITTPSPKRELMAAAFFAVMAVGLMLLPTGFEDRLPQDTQAVRAQVLSTDNANVHQYGLVFEGDQRVTARIMDGEFAGQQVSADNLFLGKLELDKLFKPGDTALVALTLAQGKIINAVAQDYYRLDQHWLLLGLFGLLLVAYAGATGLRAMLGFVLSGLLIWKVMVPLFLKGYDPIWVTLAVLAVLMAAVLFLVGGINRKALTAYLGSLLGVLATCGLAIVFAKSMGLHGSVLPYAETLLYSGYAQLDLTRIFLATIFLGASGAVMDLAMDVAASQAELARHNPGLGSWRLCLSGLRVGRVVVGTMTTTLLLAYSGAALALLMVFMAQGVPLANVFNMNHVSAEVLNTMVGSLGLVLVAPFTAVVGATLLAGNKA